MITSKKLLILMVFSIAVAVLGSCATIGVGDIPEKPITNLGILEGKWRGALTDGTPVVLTINADGSWKNALKGQIFVGSATISGGKVRAESSTTGGKYYWRLNEGNGRRALTWVDIGSGKVIAICEFSSTK